MKHSRILSLTAALILSCFSVVAYADIETHSIQTFPGLNEETRTIYNKSKYYLNTPLNISREQDLTLFEIGKQITIWLIKTDDLSIRYSSGMAKIVKEGMPNLLEAFNAAAIVYCIEHNLKRSDKNSFISAMKSVLEYYKTNRAVLDKNETLEKWLKMSPEDLDKTISAIAP